MMNMNCEVDGMHLVISCPLFYASLQLNDKVFMSIARARVTREARKNVQRAITIIAQQ